MSHVLTPYPPDMPDDAWSLLLDCIRGKFPTDPGERHHAVHVLHDTTGYVLSRVYPDPMPMGASAEAPEVTSETPKAYAERICQAQASGGMKGMGKIDWQKLLQAILTILPLFFEPKPQ